jgi:hypothetical protein
VFLNAWRLIPDIRVVDSNSASHRRITPLMARDRLKSNILTHALLMTHILFVAKTLRNGHVQVRESVYGILLATKVLRQHQRG